MSPLNPSILHLPNSSPVSARHILIFLITGNPGLIAYYTTFLSTLHSLLESPSDSKSTPGTPATAFTIYGRSFDGFENESSSENQNGPYSLGEQISHTIATLRSQRIRTGPRKGQDFDGVVLIGHSVGSFVLLEILRLARQEQDAPRIVAGFLLFPTVVRIAQSRNGVILTSLLRIPWFVSGFSAVARALMWVFPWGVLKTIVGIVMRMPDDAAEVTTGFLKGRNGVLQALYMAQDEMIALAEDKWEGEIWGIATADTDPKMHMPKLVFYWGQNDHWVDDSSRDALIAARGEKEGDQEFSSRPKMIMDQDGIPHSFCIRHSEIMAEKVKAWIDDIIDISLHS